MKAHNLKTWPVAFADVVNGLKTFEFRKNDRYFNIGDLLVLREWDPDKREYTGNAFIREVTYILLGGIFEVPEDYCVLGIGPCLKG